MKEVVIIIVGSSKNNSDEFIRIFGKKIRVKCLGVDFNMKLIEHLIVKYKDSVDVLAVSGLPDDVVIKGKTVAHPLLKKYRKLAGDTPLINGARLRKLLVNWSLHQFVKKDPNFFKGKTVSFFSGSIHQYVLSELKTFGANVQMADHYFLFGFPKLMKTKKDLDKFLQNSITPLTKINFKSLRKNDFSKKYLKYIPGFKQFFYCDYFFVNTALLDYIILPDLTGKSVIVDFLSPHSQKILEDKNVKNIYACSVNLPDYNFHGFTHLETVFQALKEEKAPLTESEILEMVDKLNLRPKTIEVHKKRPNRFAFIIHPLSMDHLFKIPFIRPLRNVESIKGISERLVSHAPGFYYGSIKGIKSEQTGMETIGDIFIVPETPKMMMEKDASVMYEKMSKVATAAKARGAQIMGLGAYTKIVGDAGVTVNEMSPLPVTTGNSLSATATLWAASFAIERMGFVEHVDGQHKGTVMVVGATGSIGKVNSKVLCQNWDRVIIVAPKPYKLIDLQDELKKINPDCEVIYSTNPNDYTGESDLIITTTSAQGKKILDIEKVKPGCVICDVSRPFDISQEDALLRPDVLVIASGEVELPGNIEMNIDIGLSGKVVYACLAETAILALEERFESFSLSRDISYEKVFQIDELARKHGVRLSAIMSHKSEITEDEIRLCRGHALAALAKNPV
jgi:predicted amino acid dehydrogenase